MGLLLIVSLVWAFSFGLIKHHLAGVDSAFVAGARVLLALLVFLPFWRLRAVPAASAIRLVLIGAVQFGLMYLAYLAAFRSLAAYQIAVLTIFTPFWVCLFDDVLARRFRLRPYAAALLAVAGAGVVIWTRSFGTAAWEGVLLVQASNACFALGQVFYRRWRARAPADVADRSVFAWLYLGAALAAVPAGLPAAGAALPALGAAQWLVLAYLGVLASGLCFFLWNLGATRTGAGALAAMNNAKIPLAVACSLLFFGESVDLPRLFLGGALLAAAVWLAGREPGRSLS